MTITCSEQPGTQIIGIVSSGPDGAPGTDDDVSSWSIDRDLATSLRGPRWRTDVAIKPKPPELRGKAGSTKKQPPQVTTPPTTAKPAVQYDENGLPIIPR